MKALELATVLERSLAYQQESGRRVVNLEDAVLVAATELRRLAEVNAELLVALESVRLCVKEFGIGQQLVFVDLAISKAKSQQ